MNPIPPLLHWLSRVLSPPRGRHRPRAAATLPSTGHAPVRWVPDLHPIRMDDPTDPRRYAMIREPFRRWEVRGGHASNGTPEPVRGGLLHQGVG